MIPIYDNFGRAVGFGARLLPQTNPTNASKSGTIFASSTAKYINSPETQLFKKVILLSINQ